MLRNLVMAVSENPGVWLLHGPPRIGKTEIAVEAGRRLEGRHPVIFLNCRRLTRADVFGALALQDDNCVVILDDLDSDDLAAIVPDLRVRVICTSRRSDFRFAPVTNCLEVTGFNPDEVDQLLKLNVMGDDIAIYQKAWRALARRMDGSPAALVEAANILRLHATYSRGTVLEMLRSFNAPQEHEQWREAAAEVPEHAQGLLKAYAVCAPQGTWLHLAGAVAGIDAPADRIRAHEALLSASLLRCINPEREYYRLHPLIRESLRQSDWWDDWRDRHYHTLTQWLNPPVSDRMDWRKCLGENAIAARWLAEKERYRLIPDLLERAIEEIPKQRPSVDLNADSGLVRRHYYLQGRLYQLLGEPDRALQNLNRYLQRCQELGKWEDAADAMALLASTCLLPPPPPKEPVDSKDGKTRSVPDIPRREAVFVAALRLLEEQTELYREHGDWAGEARSLGSRAVLLLERGEVAEAERLLSMRARLLAKKKMRQALPRIDEDHGYLPQLWEALLLLRESRTNPASGELTDEIRERLASQPRKDAGYGAASAVDAVLQTRVDSNAAGPYSLPTRPSLIAALTSRYAEALDLIDEQQGNLREDQKEELCACYANRAAILVYDQQEYARALVELKKQEDLSKRLHDWQGLAECYGSQGAIYWEVEHFRDHARDCFERKLAIELELQFEEALAFQLWDRGVLEALHANDARDVATAAGYLMEASLIIDRLGYEDELARLQEDVATLDKPQNASAAGSS